MKFGDFRRNFGQDDDWTSSRRFPRDDFYGTPLILREEKEGLTVRKLYRSDLFHFNAILMPF